MYTVMSSLLRIEHNRPELADVEFETVEIANTSSQMSRSLDLNNNPAVQINQK
jgi:hypothetical protein